MEVISQSEYSELLYRATVAESITGIRYLEDIVGKYAVQLELFSL
jgi:hypothetical protein